MNVPLFVDGVGDIEVFQEGTSNENIPTSFCFITQGVSVSFEVWKCFLHGDILAFSFLDKDYVRVAHDLCDVQTNFSAAFFILGPR